MSLFLPSPVLFHRLAFTGLPPPCSPIQWYRIYLCRSRVFQVSSRVSWQIRRCQHLISMHRYYLTYHTAPQVVWGFSIGLLFGSVYYAVVELLPIHSPQSMAGRTRTWILTNPVSTWLRLRDGWAVYPDSGTETHWQQWRSRYDALSRQGRSTVAKKGE